VFHNTNDFAEQDEEATMPGLQYGSFGQSVELPNWKPGTIQFHQAE
jgi:hypothetical protein